jgi:hypothetical protein
MGGVMGGLMFYLYGCLFFYWIPKSNNSQCPEEELTTCSGGPTINCHKRGLWGEIYL